MFYVLTLKNVFHICINFNFNFNTTTFIINGNVRNENKRIVLKQKKKEIAKDEQKKKIEEEYTKTGREEMAALVYEKWLVRIWSILRNDFEGHFKKLQFN